MIRKPGKFLPVFAALLIAAASCLAQSVMTHHVRDVVSNGKAQANGRLPGNQVLQLDLVLPLRDPAGLKAFLADVYNPKSPNYRQFLTPAEFTARFGPTVDDYETVVRFAKTYGFEVVGGSRDGMLVQVKGTVSNIEAAFHVNMRTYQHPTENRTFFSPDREPTLDLPFNLWHISGLDNYSLPQSAVRHEQRRVRRGPRHRCGESRFPRHHRLRPVGLLPRQRYARRLLRIGTALTGAGQNLGLLEYYGTDLADLTTYFKNVGQTNNVPVTLLSTDGTSTSCYTIRACDDTEQTLDMTQAIGMAPGLASLVMYVGSTDTSIISAMTTHNPLPTTIGCSWGWTPADPSTLDPYFQKMAAQGQNFFAASGDYSTWKASGNAAAWPADDAYVVSVGGTDLTTSSAAGPWASETAWVDSGGGISPDRHRHSLVAATLRRHQFQQQGIDHAAQRPGRLGQRQLHLLHLRRSDKPARPTTTAAPALPRPCGPASSRWSTSSTLNPILDNDTSGSSTPPSTAKRQCHHLRRGLPRHQERHLRQLFRRRRLRSRHWMGQPDSRSDHGAHRTAARRLQHLCVSHVGLHQPRQQRIHDHQ